MRIADTPVMTVAERIHARMLAFGQLSPADRERELQEARAMVTRAPGMQHASVCWRGLSAVQLEAAAVWARNAAGRKGR